MIKPKHELKILRQWALDELKLVSQRAFEFAKFFFAASVASFGIIPFFDSSFSLGNIFQLIGVLLLGLSAFWSIRMLEPPTFVISATTALSEEHAKYANRIKRLRSMWLFCWIFGIVFLVIGLTTDVEVQFIFDRG